MCINIHMYSYICICRAVRACTCADPCVQVCAKARPRAVIDQQTRGVPRTDILRQLRLKTSTRIGWWPVGASKETTEHMMNQPEAK